jgi:NAD(P)-dependent dehydrogenase (short-subunit alcohol dehydrogenase family)
MVPVLQVFVAGATGQTGRRVVEQLRRKGINVRAGVRDLKKAQSLGLAVPGGSSAGSVELVEFDVTAPQENIVAAIGNADAVVYVPRILSYTHMVGSHGGRVTCCTRRTRFIVQVCHWLHADSIQLGRTEAQQLSCRGQAGNDQPDRRI